MGIEISKDFSSRDIKFITKWFDIQFCFQGIRYWSWQFRVETSDYLTFIALPTLDIYFWSKKTNMASTSSLIVWQQSVADSLLARLEAIDSHCIIAGGAPRDWYLGRQAKDLDVYLYVPRNSLLRHFKTQLAAIGITNIEQSTLSMDDARYIINPLVRWVFNYEEDGEKVQLIVMKESTYTSVVQHFPLSICKVWYKGGKIIPYSRQFTETTDRKAIVKTGTEYSSDGWYIDKILAKFPEFTYYESMSDFVLANDLTT